MFGADESPSAFTSQGQDRFPPIYEDGKDVRNFSDENKWPVKKLIARYAMYSAFVGEPKIMPRAKQHAERIMKHIEFEFPYRDIVLKLEDETDCPTGEIDVNVLNQMLEESD